MWTAIKSLKHIQCAKHKQKSTQIKIHTFVQISITVLTRCNRSITLNGSSTSMKWAFGWSCYGKAWVTFLMDLVLFQLFNNRFRPRCMCSVLKLFTSPLIFPTCWVLPPSLPARVHLHSLLMQPWRCLRGDGDMYYHVSSRFSIFLWRTQKADGDWKQHEHATAKTRLKYEKTLRLLQSADDPRSRKRCPHLPRFWRRRGM